MKERLRGLDFIRILSTAGIIVIHVYLYLSDKGNTQFNVLLVTENYSVGNVIVMLFFILSGASVYYTTRGSFKILDFYKKRWLALFPMFYIAFAFFYFRNVLLYRSPFYGGNPVKLLFSLAGMDGYFSYRVSTYYILGEWFLGALIILYLIYPLVLACFQKQALLTLAVSAGLYVFQLLSGIFTVSHFRNIFYCLLGFILGMCFIKYKKYFENLPAALVCAAGFVCLTVFKLPLEETYLVHVLSLMLFVALNYIGKILLSIFKSEAPVRFLCNLSYPVYLVHHVMIYLCMGYVTQVDWGYSFLYLLYVTVVILLQAFVLLTVTNKILHTKHK